MCWEAPCTRRHFLLHAPDALSPQVLYKRFKMIRADDYYWGRQSQFESDEDESSEDDEPDSITNRIREMNAKIKAAEAAADRGYSRFGGW